MRLRRHEVDLAQNTLSGEIPRLISRMKFCNICNQLSGQIPSVIGLMQALAVFRFKLQHPEWTYPSYSRKFDLRGEIKICRTSPFLLIGLIEWLIPFVALDSRQATISVDAMLEILQRSAEEKEKKLEEEDEAFNLLPSAVNCFPVL
ncbi:unnamed protein product [Camellia sinensis]